MRNLRRLLMAASIAAVMLFAGCTPNAPTSTTTPAVAAPDFTEPGTAKAMVHRLLDAAGTTKALMVRIAEDNVQVSVLSNNQAVTWAYRDGSAAKVASDLQYVDQAIFDVDSFNFSDVGALFRAAAGQSGSSSHQSLTIVDPSGGQVVMSVSTEPESRTVFFNADGSLIPTLDFNTSVGISQGIQDVLGGRTSLYSLTVISDQNVQAEFAGPGSTTIRRSRTSKMPPITTVRSTPTLHPFAADRINPSAIWRVVNEVRGSDDVPEDSTWSVTIDGREKLSQPRMYFTFGFKVVMADLNGDIIQ